MNLTMGRNNLTKLNEKTSCICGKAFQENSSYGFGRTLANQRGALQVFFSNKFAQVLKH